jgi:hypothetical protein
MGDIMTKIGAISVLSISAGICFFVDMSGMHNAACFGWLLGFGAGIIYDIACNIINRTAKET